jgi:hypothetical protein
MNTSLTQVTPATLVGALRVCIAAREPAFTWGSPGIGKSDIVRQLAQQLGAYLIDVRASQWDAVDTRGVPYVAHTGTFRPDDASLAALDGDATSIDETPNYSAAAIARQRELLKVGAGPLKTTRWAIPSVFPSAELAAKYPLVIIFLDELNAAPPSVQAALYQLVLDRRLGDYVLPDNVVILAAGNLESDRAVTHRMSTALASRFLHFELLVDHLAWERWALANGVHTATISFLRYRPALLHSFDPKSASKAQPLPRTWEKESKVITQCELLGINGAVETALICGAVGDAAGMEKSGFMRIYRTLPDPDQIILAPDSVAIPTDPATNYALCGALAERTTVANARNVFRFAERLRDDVHAGPEFMTLLVRSISVRRSEVCQTRPFIEWASRNSDVLL